MISTPFEIRALGASDVAGFLRLKEVGLAADPFSFVASADEDPPDYAERVRQRLESVGVPGGDVVLGAFAPELVGVVAVTRHEHAKRRHKADLHGMFVEPAHRGRGVGRALLSEVLRLSRAMEGLEEIQLVVATHNQGAVGLYREFGFVESWTEPHALKVGGRYVDAHHMRLVVGEEPRR